MIFPDSTFFKKCGDYAPSLLRICLSLVFLWFGLMQLFEPNVWTAYLPEWVRSIPISEKTLVSFNGLFEIFFGFLLLIGFYTRLDAFILALHLFGISLSIGLTATGIRDFGLTFATFAIFLFGPDKLCIDWLLKEKFDEQHLYKKRSPIFIKVVAILLVLSITLNIAFISNRAQNAQSTIDSSKSLLENETIEKVKLTPEIVGIHRSINDCWLIVSNKVYDVTTYIISHPGGKDEIIPFCGKDATQAFQTKGGRDTNHSEGAFRLLESYYIGDLYTEQIRAIPLDINQTPSNNYQLPSGSNQTISAISNLTNKTASEIQINKTTIISLNLEEIAKHNTPTNCWLLILGKVYDVSMYINLHPGGAQTIISNCGTDATTAFQTKGDKGKDHSANAYALLNLYYIGELNSNSTVIGQVNNTLPKGSYCDMEDAILKKYSNGQVKEIRDKEINYEAKVISEGSRYKIIFDRLGNMIEIKLEDPEAQFTSQIKVCDIENKIFGEYPGVLITEIKWRARWEAKFIYKDIIYKIIYNANGELISFDTA